MTPQSIEGNLQRIDVILTPSSFRYSLIYIPKEFRDFFPGYKVNFILETNIGPRIAHMTAGDKSDIPVGERSAGVYIVGRLREWYEHNELEVGDLVRVREIEHHKRYRISKLEK